MLSSTDNTLPRNCHLMQVITLGHSKSSLEKSEVMTGLWEVTEAIRHVIFCCGLVHLQSSSKLI